MNQKASGFASPAQGYEEEGIDLNRLLIRNPPATYFFRLNSADMVSLGLPQGSLLVVDRSKVPTFNEYALIQHEGQFLCRLLTAHKGTKLFTNGKEYITPIANETEVIGAVTASICFYNNVDAH
jgi:DNA polymerase V